MQTNGGAVRERRSVGDDDGIAGVEAGDDADAFRRTGSETHCSSHGAIAAGYETEELKKGSAPPQRNQAAEVGDFFTGVTYGGAF